MNDNPFVGKFPLFKKVLNISEASWCGPKKISGRMTAKKPKICTTRMRPSTLGSSLPITVFTETAKLIAAQNKRTVCHALGSYDGCVMVISPWMSVPEMYETDATLVCHPQTVSQPVSRQSLHDLIVVFQTCL